MLRLYDDLLALAPTPVVALNRAVAVAEVQGPAAGLALVDELELPQYYLCHAVRADLLRRLGREHRGRRGVPGRRGADGQRRRAQLPARAGAAASLEHLFDFGYRGAA